MCADSFASSALGGMDPLALGLEHRRHRMLREPVDLEVGMQLAQLLRDRDVAAGMPETDRRGDVERAPAPAECPRPRPRLRRRRHDLVRELLEQAVHLHRVPRRRDVPRALEPDERSARELRDCERPLARLAVVQLTVDDEHGAPDACDEIARLLRGRERRRGLLVGEDERLHASVETPPDAVLDLLRRVRLGELLREEELEEAAEVALPVVDVPLGPALVGVERLGRRIAAIVRMSRCEAGYEGRDRRDTERECRVRRGEHERVAAAVAESAQERGLRPGRLEHSAAVLHDLPVRVRLSGARPVGAAVPARVERDDAKVAREIRDLRLPQPRVRDRRGREEQEGRRRVAVDLVEDAHAVALDVALLVRIAGARLLAFGCGDGHGSRSTKAWRRRLNATGSRACGACPPPSTRTKSPPPCSASASPRV